MKFEKPSIEICVFDTEDIVTTSGTTATNADFDAAVAKAENLDSGDKMKAVVKITF